MLYRNTWNKIIEFYDDYSFLVSEAKYITIHREGIKLTL